MLNRDKAFEKQYLDEEREKPDVFSLRLSKEEREEFNKAKEIIQQTKDSTAIKQLAFIGIANVRHDQKTTILLSYLFKNKRNNQRLGIVDFD